MMWPSHASSTAARRSRYEACCHRPCMCRRCCVCG
jgi:hypothetical protein